MWSNLKQLAGVRCFDPAAEVDLESLPVKLPTEHLELLRVTNGLVSSDGCLRVFGTNPAVRNQSEWNDLDCWRFARQNACEGFWFFAEMADGGQYAYETRSGKLAREWIVYLDPVVMKPRWTLPNFETFVSNVIVNDDRGSRGVLLDLAKNKFGSIPSSKLAVGIPHPCLAGESDPVDTMLMNAREAMVMNADLWSEINRVGDIDSESRVETYIDESGRTRFRINTGRE